jgi:hypothetical protein
MSLEYTLNTSCFICFNDLFILFVRGRWKCCICIVPENHELSPAGIGDKTKKSDVLLKKLNVSN